LADAPPQEALPPLKRAGEALALPLISAVAVVKDLGEPEVAGQLYICDVDQAQGGVLDLKEQDLRDHLTDLATEALLTGT
jgi:hypothetical protein